MIRSFGHRRAFTMLEVFAVLLLISMLVMLLLPAVQSSRESARRTSCANNLMQVALGVQSYHATFDQLPTQLSGTDGSTVPGEDNDRRLSFLVGLLPFVGQPELSELIRHPLARTAGNEYGSGTDLGMMLEADMDSILSRDEPPSDQPQWVAGGPEPFDWRYIGWMTEPPVFRCPSDPGAGDPAQGRTNYAACLGDGVVAADSGPMKEVSGRFVVDPDLAKQTQAAMRGVFVPRVVTRLSDVTDGLSYTIMLGEIATDLGDKDIRTHPIEGPGAEVLRDNPLWARESGLIDFERPFFWADANSTNTLDSNRRLGRGFRWADGMPLYTGFNTILPPNREIVLRDDRDDCWGILPPSSRHQGGVQVCFADGMVRFVADDIDSGRSTEPTVYPGSANPPGSESPYGIWGALGTRASAELKAHGAGSRSDFR